MINALKNVCLTSQGVFNPERWWEKRAVTSNFTTEQKFHTTPWRRLL